MRVLYISQYFPPEAGATQDRAYEMARNWARLGHSVTMLAEIPNHPSGIIHPTFRGKLIHRETLDGIDVIRVWVKTSPKKNFINRILFYISFMINASLAGLFLTSGKFDFVYATSPPLFVGASALLLSTIKQAKLIFEVRDLWPESAVVLNELSNPTAIKLSTNLEELCYKKSLRIVVVTKSIYRRLLERGIYPKKLLIVPNGANLDQFSFDPNARVKLRRELNLETKFVVMYAGIFGIAQGLETILYAADKLKNNQDIQFVLIGEGPQKEQIQNLALELELRNVTILDGKPLDIIPSYLSVADISIIPLKNLDLFRGALPSKLFHAWACERPVILSVDGEARELVKKAQGGKYIPPENVESLVKTILELKDAPEIRRQMGKNGREFTLEYYSRRKLATELIDELSLVIENG
jgi:glycosyltransferase involved in cell wall biosynthesis